MHQRFILKERLPLEEVFEQLRTSRQGLTSEDAEARIQIFGQNKLEEKPVSIATTFGIINHSICNYFEKMSSVCWSSNNFTEVICPRSMHSVYLAMHRAVR